uniref:Lipocalin/cytosolic fatty-acid binding domain-containing protein n=1 Tax=Mandrillus leucophaeus TaxID=9568 RepID=A0A2K5XQR3_MANLE
MPCLLLTLGVALISGVWAIDSPQTMQDVEGFPRAVFVLVTSTCGLEAPLSSVLGVWPLPPSPGLQIGHHSVCAHRSQKQSPFRESNQCIEEKIIAEKTENPIEFKINYLDENRIYLFNTDGSKYLFLCLESTPRQNLACQYLARTLEVDDKVMAEFISFLKTLPVHMQIFLDMTQAEEQCRV